MSQVLQASWQKGSEPVHNLPHLICLWMEVLDGMWQLASAPRNKHNMRTVPVAMTTEKWEFERGTFSRA